MKTVFTTGEAAKICKVSQQTIIRCFDNGQLKGFRVPGSRFRRIPREALYRFMKDNGIPTDALESGKRKVLLVDDDLELVELMTKVLEEDGRFEVRIASNGFDAGMMVKEYRPDLIVLDVMLPDINGKEVCHRVRADPSLEDVRILCISDMIEEDKIQELRLSGADDFLHKPFDIEELIDRMCAQLELEPALAARLLAERSQAVAPQRAWAAGLLAPLGWLAVAAVDPSAVSLCRDDRAYSHQPAAIARRLARRWRLPAWLAAVVGHLDLPLDTAPVDAADAATFALAQAPVALAGDDALRL